MINGHVISRSHVNKARVRRNTMGIATAIHTIGIFFLIIGNCHTQVAPFTEKCVTGSYPPKVKSVVPTFTISLDLPPSQRWAEIGKLRGPQISELVQTLKQLFRILGNSTAKALFDFVDKDMGYLAYLLPQPYSDELVGLAKAANIPLGEIVLYNVFYEIFTVCTSVVAEDPKGQLYHARNLDFGLFMGWDVRNHTWLVTEKLRPMVINLEYKQKGRIVYKSVNFAGYIGVLTGMKPTRFTLTVNERFDLMDGGYIGIAEWLLGIKSGRWMGFLTRDILQNADSFTKAKSMLSTTTLLAPVYFIVGGNQSGEGAIITRSRHKPLQILNLEPGKGKWYLLQTNYDQWKKPLFIDDRRTPGHRCMDKVTRQNIGFPSLFDVLSSKPVLNKLTTYTTLMQATSGKMETYLQHCTDPCWLF